MTGLRNRVCLIGFLGQDPEVKNLDGGKMVANVRLATSDSYKNSSGEKVENTQWHSLSMWGNLAEVANSYLKKGSEVAVDGRIVYRTYEDKDGITRQVTEIVVNDMLMLGKKGK
jgi:single-strand DNA-binding protein